MKNFLNCFLKTGCFSQIQVQHSFSHLYTLRLHSVPFVDSLCYEVTNTDVYKALASADFMDFSNYDKSHPLYSTCNYLKPGYLKDETGGQPIEQFIGLRCIYPLSKQYSVKTKDFLYLDQKCIPFLCTVVTVNRHVRE